MLDSEIFAVERTQVFGHRGASGYAPQNTLPAFELAVEMGCDGIELDVHLTTDGHLVIIHDDDVSGTTDGSGEVSEMSLADAKALDAGSWFDAEFAGVRIPTLDEVFESVGDKLFVNVEIKGMTEGIEQATADCIRKHKMSKRVIISSFNPNILRKFSQVAPDMPIGYLYAPQIPPEVTQLMMGVPHQARHPYHEMIDQTYMTQAQTFGYKVNTWTVNDADRAVELKALGVDVIMTDIPDVIRSALGYE